MPYLCYHDPVIFNMCIERKTSKSENIQFEIGSCNNQLAKKQLLMHPIPKLLNIEYRETLLPITFETFGTLTQHRDQESGNNHILKCTMAEEKVHHYSLFYSSGLSC